MKCKAATNAFLDMNSLNDVMCRAIGTGAYPLDDIGFADGSAKEPPWVLCIDDDPDYSNALKHRLECYGIAVIRAFEGTEGYRTAFTRPANVILLDYEMPNGCGDYLLGRLKDNAVTKDIPVIVVTGRRDQALKRKMLNLGAEAFLTKPLALDELLPELRKHIDVLPRVASASSTKTAVG